MAQTGLNWILAVDTAEDNTTPTWKNLPGQRGGNLAFSKSTVDATSKDRAGWEDSVATRRGWSASADGILDENTPGGDAILYLVDTNQLHATDVNKPVHVKLTNEDGDTFIGWADMEEFSIDFPESDLVSYSCSFKGRSSEADGTLRVPAQTRA